METVESTDGTPIAFERTGAGPPLVLVHGSTADHTRWDPVLPAFEERFTVYALDRRGRGASGDTPAYEMEREVEDVVAVVESIADPVTLLGHSYGAMCALEAARRLPTLRALVLYEPPIPVAGFEPDSEETLAEITVLHERGENKEALVRFLRDIAELPPFELDALRSAPNWPARVEAAHTVIREERARTEYEFDPARFAELQTPTLLLVGTETAPLHAAAADALGDVLENSRVVLLEGQAHAAMNTAPELVIDAVLTFDEEVSV
ncbi:alpha/beta fold hydrolase [Haloferax namakaokahaiae]|uniref:Alpha/beta fold hydrolase n=1 Tax=Haloferax namakaokahaiae TaxID=1748331 RepID=A0ABD5ZCI1_9EURY